MPKNWPLTPKCAKRTLGNKPFVNPYLAVLVGVFAVSFSALFVRLTTAPALIIATYRLLFTFLTLAPYALYRYRPELCALPWKQRAMATASGLCLALHFVTWFTSLRYTSVASSVVLVTTQPVFVVIGSWIFFKERVSRLSMIGGGLALFGSVIIGAADFKIGQEALFGDLLALAAAILVSGYLLIGRRLRSGVSLPVYTFYTYGSSAFALVVTSFATATPFAPYPPRDWLLFLGLALVCTVVGHTVFNWVLRYVQASVVSVSVLGEPLGAILWASIFLSEYPTLRQTIGAGFIFGGLFIFTRYSAGAGTTKP